MALLTGRLPFDTGVRDDDVVAGALKDERTAAVADAARSRLRDGRHRLVRTAAQRNRHRARASTSSTTRCRRAADGDRRTLTAGDLRRDGAESEAVAERWLTTSARRGSSCFSICTSLTRRTRRRPGMSHRPGRWRRTTAAIAYADEIVGRFVALPQDAPALRSIHDRASCPTTAKGWAITANRNTGCSSTTKRSTCHSSSSRPAAWAPDDGSPTSFSKWTSCPRCSTWRRRPSPANLRGRSLKPLADGATAARLPDEAVYAEAFTGSIASGGAPSKSLTDGRYQYIRAPREELYDLERDPRQRENAGGEIDAPPYAKAPRRSDARPAPRQIRRIAHESRNRLASRPTPKTNVRSWRSTAPRWR